MNEPLSDARFYYRHERHDAALSVCSIGYERTGKGYRWGPGSRAYYLLQHVVSGDGVLRQQDKTYLLHPGDTFITFPKQSEHLTSDSEDWEYVWVGFSGTEAMMLLNKLRLSETSPILHSGNDLYALEIHQKIYQSRGALLSDSIEMTGYLYLLFAHLMQKMNVDSQLDDTDQFQQALIYIDNHIMSMASVNDLCRSINISRSHLYRIFVSHIGQSPIRYILNQRIIRSCYYLHNTSMRISEIAYAFGYSDPLYYSRVFKSVMGVSPLQYKRINASTNAKESAAED